MADEQQGPSWPDLPPDLLGDVLRRVPALVDRVRVAAVCRPWRSICELLPPPPPQHPWLVFLRDGGALFDLANAHRSPFPHCYGSAFRIPADADCFSAGEDLLFVLHHDGWCSLVHPLSGAAAHLPELAAILLRYGVRAVDPHKRHRLRKVVASPSAHGGLLVALLVRGAGIVVSTCRPAGEANSCLVMRGDMREEVADIALFQGRICALTSWSPPHTLLALELDSHGRLDRPTPPGAKPEKGRGATWVRHHPRDCQGDYSDYDYDSDDDGGGGEDEGAAVEEKLDSVEDYLVESNGKLLMVNRLMGGNVTRRFEVWEADLSDGLWKRFGDDDGDDNGLDGQALFVSAQSSKSIPAAAIHGAREDCIYFLNQLHVWSKLESPFGDSGVYDVRDKEIMPLLPESLPRESAWFFPAASSAASTSACLDGVFGYSPRGPSDLISSPSRRRRPRRRRASIDQVTEPASHGYTIGTLVHMTILRILVIAGVTMWAIGVARWVLDILGVT